VKNQVIAKRYSRALFTLALEANAVEQYGTELDGFDKVLKDLPDLENALRNPLYPAGVKMTIFEKVAAQLELSPIMKSFSIFWWRKGAYSTCTKLSIITTC